MSVKAIEKKKKLVSELKEKIEAATVMVISDYRGLTVKQITELRKKLYGEESELRIFKNTIISRAVDEAGYAELKEHLSGPVALLLGYKDPVGPVKALVEFVTEIEKGAIKAGMMEKTLVDLKKIEEISKLPAKEVLIAKAVGGFQAPIYGFVNVLAGTMRKFLYALNAVKEKKGNEGGEK
ncbi:MAG: 50S ribosomal protein L10 [bacterium]